MAKEKMTCCVVKITSLDAWLRATVEDGGPPPQSMYDAALKHVGSPPEPISVDEYAMRVNRLTAQLRPGDLLVVPCSPSAVHSNDVHYPYRTQSDMLYLVGWDEPEAVLTIHHADEGWIRTIFVQPKDTLKEIWEGRRPGVEGALEGWAVDAAHSCDDLGDRLNELLSASKRVLMRTGIRSDLDTLVMQSLERRDRARQHFGTAPD